jgi:hypothetical protein
MKTRYAFAAGVLALACATAAQAALPPYYQRSRELQAILDDAEVGEKLRQAPIDRIERVGEDRYQVQAGGCRLDVRIVGTPSPGGRPGPRPFKVKVGKVACR